MADKQGGASQAEDMLLGEAASPVTLTLLRPAAGAASTSIPLSEYSIVLRRMSSESNGQALQGTRPLQSAGAELDQAPHVCTVGGEAGRAPQDGEPRVAAAQGATEGHGQRGGVVKYEAVLQSQAAACLYPREKPQLSGAGGGATCTGVSISAGPLAPPLPVEHHQDLVSMLEHVVARLRCAPCDTHQALHGDTYPAGRQGGVALGGGTREEEGGASSDMADTSKRMQQGAAGTRKPAPKPRKVTGKAKMAGGGKINARARWLEGGRSQDARRQRCTPLVRGASGTAAPRVLGEGKRARVAVPGASAWLGGGGIGKTGRAHVMPQLPTWR